MENKLLYIFESILDSSQEEFLDTNLKSPDSIKDYANGSLEINLTDEEAHKIWLCCIAYTNKNHTFNSNEVFHYFEKLLSDN
jgi:hypothetical protein